MVNTAFNASLFDGQQAAAQEVEKKDLERAQENWRTLLGTFARISADVHARSGHEGVGDFYNFVNTGLVDFRKTGTLNLGTPAPQREVPEIQEAKVIELDDDTKQRIGRIEDILGNTLVSVGLDPSTITKIIAGKIEPKAAKKMVDELITASIASAEKPAPKLKDGEVVVSEKDVKVLKKALDGHIPTLSGLGAKMTVNGEVKDPTEAYVIDVDEAAKAQELIEGWANKK